MKFFETPLQGSYIIEPERFEDERGMFFRTFCKNEFKEIGHTKEFVQSNQSVNNKKGTIRGMHFQQPPDGEIKLIRCIRGSVYDVIIDLRKSSPTFMKWIGTELSEKNMKMQYVPEGFAHGFQTLEDHSALIYQHTAFYNPEAEKGIRFDDPMPCITWPLAVSLVSERDRNFPLLQDDFTGIEL